MCRHRGDNDDSHIYKMYFKTRCSKYSQIYEITFTNLFVFFFRAYREKLNKCLYTAIVVNKDYKEVKRLISDGADVNMTDDGWTPLMAAAEQGHVELAKLLIKHNAQVNVKDKNGKTALDVACFYGWDELIDLLLAKGCDITLSYNHGLASLMSAVMKGHQTIAEILTKQEFGIGMGGQNVATALYLATKLGLVHLIDLLIQKGSKVNATANGASCYGQLQIAELLAEYYGDVHSRNGGWTPLMIAAKNGDLDIAQLLIKHNADIALKNHAGETALHAAACYGQMQLAELLIEHYGDVHVNELRTDGWTPLMIAAKNADLDVAQLLINHDANIDLKNPDGETALHVAAFYGQEQLAELLVKHGGDAYIDKMRTDGWTPLMIAAKNGDLGVARLLVNQNADIGLKNLDGETALHVAVYCNQEKVAQMLVEKFGDSLVNEMRSDGWTPLMIVAKTGDLGVARLLMKHKACIDLQNSDGETALHVATCYGQVELAELFIKYYGAVYVDTMRTDGWTPLMIAVKNADLVAVQQLINHNANIELKNANGETALHIAACYGQEQIAKLLVEYYGDVHVNETKTDGWSPLMIAAKNGHLDVAGLLMRRKARVDLKNQDGETALHIAAFYGQMQLAQLLLDHYGNVYIDEMRLDGWTPLMIAVKNGDLDVAQLLINHNADIDMRNQTGETALHVAASYSQRQLTELLIECYGDDHTNDMRTDGWTPLMIAAHIGDMGVAQLLINHNADIYIRNHTGETALHVAACCGQVHLIELMVRHYGDVHVNKTRTDDWTPLMIAAKNGDISVAQLLINHNANTNLKNRDGETAFHVASCHSKVQLAKLLVKVCGDIDVNEKRNDGWTPLMIAAKNGDLAIAGLLMKLKAHIDLKTPNGETALHIAVCYGKVQLAMLLMEHAVDINEMRTDGWTPLMIAAKNGDMCVAQLLVNHNADVSLKKSDGETVFHVAACYGQVQLAELLIEYYGEIHIDEIRTDGWIPLMIAAKIGDFNVAKLLISHNADIHLKNPDGETALHIAACYAHEHSTTLPIEVAKLLLDAGCTVDAARNDKKTPLMIAARKGNLNVAQLLLNHNANIKCVDNNSATALHIAADNGQPYLVDLLLKSGSDINATDKNDRTPLLYASRKCHLHIAELLIKHKASINWMAKTEQGTTALHLAVFYDKIQMVQLLLENGADINVTKFNGMTPLMVAADRGLVRVAEMLINFGGLKNDNGKQAMKIAKEKKHVEMVQLLIDKRARTKCVIIWWTVNRSYE